MEDKNYDYEQNECSEMTEEDRKKKNEEFMKRWGQLLHMLEN